MSKFRNKMSGEILEANSFTELFAFSHNSNYELVEDKPKDNTKKKKEDKPKDKNDEALN